MSKEQLQSLIQVIDGRAVNLDQLDRYYNGNPPLSFLSPEAREALGNRFGRMASNFCRLTVTSISERLRITGFTRDGQPDPALWADWTRNDLDQLAGTLHREALTLGTAYCIVWADHYGQPTISVESAHQMTALRDPGTRQIVAAVKRWNTATGSEAILYGPDTITRFRSASQNATAGAQYRVAETIENPLGVVPVVEFRNSDRLLDEGVSELRDVIPLQDSLNKLLADLLVGSEYFARPRRWATGIELEEDEDGEADNPYPESNRMMIAESDLSKFGQLPASDLGSYDTAIRTIVSQIMAVSSLPGHYTGIVANQPPNADGLRAAEASLTARVEQRQHTFGRSWEKVAGLAHAIRTNTDPLAADITLTWADPATRSVAQEADAVVKLFQAGLLPVTAALEKLGYSEDQISRIRDARRGEALDGAGTDLEALLS
ncbi:phage portal protein [Nesterenkonia natronophila]|uniref:Phage portal protein n=1 Tax=Nesterenkonia natronophila TaxID=2174932 RepID=A0A3A4G3N0_9MICC|nr:phage portal protein [Nesterenkonia natronophila]RJN32909.1 phage portal protein [Nesterenkonia natronophila]